LTQSHDIHRRQPVITGSSGATVHEQGDIGVREAHSRFGGVDVPATLVGMLAALALLAILGGLVAAAIGAIGYQTDLDTSSFDGNRAELSIAGLAGGVVLLFVTYLVGGWAAGRMARYDGGRNGFMTGVWTLLLGAILAGLGAWLGSEYNVLDRIPNVPNWFSRDAVTAGAIASGAVAVVGMLLGGFLGGRLGGRYHRRIDGLIAATRAGGIPVTPSTAPGTVGRSRTGDDTIVVRADDDGGRR
jgi:hypothetical protein